MEIKMICTQNIEMEYIQFGKGEKTLVILPGLGLSKIILSAAAIEERYSIFSDDYTIYVFDRKNNLEKGSSVESIANDTVTVMKELGLKDINLFGASFGGMIAMTIAIKEKELISKLFLASTVAEIDETTKTNLSFWTDNASKDNLPVLLEDMLTRIYSPEYINPVKESLISSFMDTDEKTLRHFKIQAQATDGFNILPELDEIKCPVFVAASRNDQVLSYRSMEKMISKLGCYAYIYKDASHALYDEDPFFVDIVRNFFNQ